MRELLEDVETLTMPPTGDHALGSSGGASGRRTGAMTTEEQASSTSSRCRFCGETLRDTVVDLGMSPLCESYVRPDQLNGMEPFYPLHVEVCRACWLVQLDEYVAPEHIFSEYAYFSSFSDSWVQHARRYTEQMIDRFGFGPHSQVIELASN